MPKKNNHVLKLPTTSLTFKIVLVALLLTAFYLRTEPAYFGLTHFSYDQGLDQILVKKVFIDHQFSFISRFTGLTGVYMGPWFTWFMGIPYLLSAGNPSANVIFLGAISTLAVVYSFFLVKKMSSQVSAVIFSLLLIFSPENVSVSYIVFNPGPIHFLILPYLFLIYSIIKHERYQLLVPLALLISLFFQLEIGFAAFALFAAAITLLVYKKLLPLKTKWFLISLPVFIFPFIPQIIFDLRHDHIIANAILDYFSGTNTSLGVNLPLDLRLPNRLTLFVSDYLSASAFRLENKLAVTATLIAVGSGWYFNIRRNNKTAIYLGKLILLLLAFFYLGFLLYPGEVWGWYRAGLPVLFLLFSSLGLAGLFRDRSPTTLALAAYMIFICLIGLHPIGHLDVWANRYQDNVSTLRNQQQILDSIYEDAQGQPFALYVYTPPIYPYIWDYQLQWYVLKTYNYLPRPYDIHPQPGNPENIYLIIEPDQYADRIGGWQGNFRALGSRVKSWSSISGVVVEKWQFDRQPEVAQPLIKFVDALSSN